MANGFAYAHMNNFPVPNGLKRMCRVYLDRGLKKMLEYVKNKYLQSVALRYGNLSGLASTVLPGK